MNELEKSLGMPKDGLEVPIVEHQQLYDGASEQKSDKEE